MALDHSRREFLRTTLAGGAAVFAATHWPSATWGAAPATAPAATRPARAARVALTTGDDRADLAFQGLKLFQAQIAAAIGDKRIILKPNNVRAGTPLACSHAQNLEGILEFLKSIGKIGNVTIAESGAVVPTLEGFEALGYNPLARKYGVKLIDLDKEPFEVIACIDQNDMRSHPCRVSKLLLDPNAFIISATMPKTHNSVVATLSLKNIAMGAPLKLNRGSDKPIVHGGGPWAINFNLANFASRLHPHLAVIDGYQGMEGNGPVSGTAVDHRVCIVGMDWLAADRVGLELMGIDPAKVGYLSFCAQMGMGEYALERIEVLGARVQEHLRKYRLAQNIEEQLQWLKPPERAR